MFLEHAVQFGFLITLETLSFFSLKSSLEFIIISLHDMQKTRRSKELEQIWTFTTIFAEDHPSSSQPCPKGLNLSAAG